MDTQTDTDPCLADAYSQWQQPLQHGITLYEAGESKAALTPLAEAIRLSASFHPLFHFLESGLNTELAQYHLANGEWDEAKALFTRAVFLHHDNPTALAGVKLADAWQTKELSRYPILSLSSPLKPANSEAPGIHALRQQALLADDHEKVALYHQAIALCETAHKRYHQLAALPLLARARCFAALGEDALARNDIRHGMDLDRRNADLLALSASLAE